MMNLIDLPRLYYDTFLNGEGMRGYRELMWFEKKRLENSKHFRYWLKTALYAWADEMEQKRDGNEYIT